MDLLLDTHILLWSITDSENLSNDIKERIKDEKNHIYYSLASIWEVEIKNTMGKLPISGKELSEYAKESGYNLIPLNEEHVFAVRELKRPDDAPKHNDPFDRIMLAQAKVEGITFITHDSLIPYYNEKCIMKV